MTQKVALLTLETETLAEELGKVMTFLTTIISFSKIENVKIDRQQEIAKVQKAELLDDKRKGNV